MSLPTIPSTHPHSPAYYTHTPTHPPTPTTQFTTTSPSLNWTVAQLVSINATLLQLEGALAASATQLVSTAADVNTFFLGSSTSPGALASSVSSAGGALAPLSPALTTSVNTLTSTLTTAATNFAGLAGYSDLSAYASFIAAVRWVGGVRGGARGWALGLQV